ncbi:unnamed protein product, partial [Ectocarpus sp. 8 AP-2014]
TRFFCNWSADWLVRLPTAVASPDLVRGDGGRSAEGCLPLRSGGRGAAGGVCGLFLKCWHLLGLPGGGWTSGGGRPALRLIFFGSSRPFCPVGGGDRETAEEGRFCRACLAPGGESYGRKRSKFHQEGRQNFEKGLGVDSRAIRQHSARLCLRRLPGVGQVFSVGRVCSW